MRRESNTPTIERGDTMENTTEAKTHIKYDCGCGFTTTDARKAEQHVVDTGHTLDVHGRVYAEKQQKRSTA